MLGVVVRAAMAEECERKAALETVSECGGPAEAGRGWTGQGSALSPLAAVTGASPVFSRARLSGGGPSVRGSAEEGVLRGWRGDKS